VEGLFLKYRTVVEHTLPGNIHEMIQCCDLWKDISFGESHPQARSLSHRDDASWAPSMGRERTHCWCESFDVGLSSQDYQIKRNFQDFVNYVFIF
jgi:hypothetical protein